MRKFIILLGLLLLLPCSVLAQDSLHAVVDRVIDGDTIKVTLTGEMPELFRHESIRLRHCDTPEKKDHRPEIAALARQATEFTAARIAPGQEVDIFDVGFDKYGGRLLGRIIVEGEDLCEQLIGAGLAHGYEGGKKDW